MNGLDNHTYVLMLLFSNMVALVLLVTAWKMPRLSRLLFFLLFTWASWTNWQTALNKPDAYLEYADLAIFSFYKNFINGWFKNHIVLAVGFVATCQLLIAIGMQSKGNFFKVAAVGAILFLLAIAPLGVGAAFPCTVIMAIAMYLLLRHVPTNYLWVKEKTPVIQ